MEDDKKKKRNKKKKNKQNKTTEEDVAAVTDHNRVSNGKKDHDQDSEVGEVQNGAVQDADVDLDRHSSNEAESCMLAEAEKQQWLQRETALEETIRQLQNENHLHTQKEATLEETIKQLQEENDSHLQKEAALEETVRQLRTINDLCIHKQATFEETIKLLENEKESHKQKEAGLEMKIVELQSEKDLWFRKEASLGDKIKQLETEKDSWIMTENTTKETIARMNVDITRLRMQVVELEESRNSLLKENQQLMERISGLQSQLQNLESSISSINTKDELKKCASEHEDLNSQIEAASALIDKLITENAEPVEKVNELYVKPDRQSTAVGLSSAVGHGIMMGNAEMASVGDPISESREKSLSGHKLESLEVEPAAVVPYSLEANSGEIVQIPLDDNEVQDLELQVVESNEKDAVPLSDAPLIGAPFRFISFVAKYVSGADLVDKNTSN